MPDFVQYGDTDSIFLSVQNIVEHHCGLEKWNSLPDEKKLEYCKRISRIIIDYVNKRSYEDVQLKDYNSQEHNFKISFKQEIVASSGIFVAKKKYSLWVVDEEGVPKEEKLTRGLEIIQSSCPSGVKERLEKVVDAILKDFDDDSLYSQIKKDVSDLKTVIPEEIALNIGVNSVAKYSDNGEPVKGCPYQIKGLLNYRKIIKYLGLQGKAPELGSGMKVKTVYVKPNQWDYNTVSFLKWLPDFNQIGIEVDYDMMVEKTYLHKISVLLGPIGKTEMIQDLFPQKPKKRRKKKSEEIEEEIDE